MTALFSFWFIVEFSGFEIIQLFSEIFWLNNWCGLDKVPFMGGVRVVAIKNSDLDVKFEVLLDIQVRYQVGIWIFGTECRMQTSGLNV